jgi:hypothetical protein
MIQRPKMTMRNVQMPVVQGNVVSVIPQIQIITPIQN